MSRFERECSTCGVIRAHTRETRCNPDGSQLELSKCLTCGTTRPFCDEDAARQDNKHSAKEIATGEKMHVVPVAIRSWLRH